MAVQTIMSNDLFDQNEAVKNELEKLKVTNTLINDRLQTSLDGLKKLQVSHNLLISNSEMKDQELTAVMKERDTLKIDLQNKTRGHEQASAQVNKLKKENRKIETDILEITTKLNTKVAENDELKKKIEAHIEFAQLVNNDDQPNISVNTALQVSIDKLQKENSGLQEEIKHLQGTECEKLKRKNKEIASLKDSNVVLSETIKDINEKLTDSIDKLRISKATQEHELLLNDILSKQVEQKDQQIKQFEQELEGRCEEISFNAQQMSILKEQIEQYKMKYQEVEEGRSSQDIDKDTLEDSRPILYVEDSPYFVLDEYETPSEHSVATVESSHFDRQQLSNGVASLQRNDPTSSNEGEGQKVSLPSLVRRGEICENAFLYGPNQCQIETCTKFHELNFTKVRRGVCFKEFHRAGSCPRGKKCLFCHEIPDCLRQDAWMCESVEKQMKRAEQKKSDRENKNRESATGNKMAKQNISGISLSERNEQDQVKITSKIANQKNNKAGRKQQSPQDESGNSSTNSSRKDISRRHSKSFRDHQPQQQTSQAAPSSNPQYVVPLEQQHFLQLIRSMIQEQIPLFIPQLVQPQMQQANMAY